MLNIQKNLKSKTPLPPQYPIEFDMKICYGKCLEPFIKLYPGYGDDRIVCGLISHKWPFIILADGAGECIDPTTKKAIIGGGGQAAQVVVNEAKVYLENNIKHNSNLNDISKYIEDAYRASAIKLDNNNISTATTLLIALLYECSNSKNLFWFYAYEGNGLIVLINPRRKINENLIHSELLYPGQEAGMTAVVSRKGTTISPVIGCVAYEPGDIIYVASDGMYLLERTISSPGFRVDEFMPLLSIKELCEAINNDKYSIPLKANNNTLEWLNELLRVPDFFDIFIKIHPNSKLPTDIIELANRTELHRKKDFNTLTVDEENIIKKLNRLLIESAYTQKTPKSLKINISEYLYNNLYNKLDLNLLKSKLNSFQYNDDATLGLIWTWEK